MGRSCERRNTPIRDPRALERALRQVISAQESRSWLFLCDIIQYEIIPILESWKGTVARDESGRKLTDF